MISLKKLPFFLICLFTMMISGGCIEKTFYPAVEIEVTGVSPYELIPTATDTASLPTTAVSLKSLSKIPCTLKSYSIEYATKLGEPLTGASTGKIDIEVKIEAEATADITLRPYNSTIVNIFDTSFSDISPIRARINLNFQDLNGNWVSRDANCLLFKLE